MSDTLEMNYFSKTISYLSILLLLGCISNPFNSIENVKEEEPEIKKNVVIWANILNRTKGDTMYIFYEKRFLTQEECIEYLVDAEGNSNDMARKIPNVICRGPQVTLVAPEQGFAQISNPFANDADE